MIGAEDISELDEEHGMVESRVERAVTEGLRQVLDPTTLQICFSSGHGEPAVDDAGPTGLLGLEYTLRKNNYETRELDLGAASSDAAAVALRPDCRGGTARQPEPGRRCSELVLAVRRGKSVLASIGPSLGDDQRPIQSGFEPLLELFGLRVKPGIIFERDPDAVLPVGLGGEAFLASPVQHAITEGLIHEGEPRYRVLLQLAQGLERTGAVAPSSSSGTCASGSGARRTLAPDAPNRVSSLLRTSDRAFAVLDAARLAEGDVELDSLKHDSDGPFTVAFAAELGPSSKDKRAGRLVVIGSPSPLLGATWQDATLAGTRRFIESAVSWLVSRPALVSVPDKPGRQVELRFTEESLAEVVRYVLVYMPGTALALGALILYRRRSASAARVRCRPEAGKAQPSGGGRNGREGGAP